jgi:hypothetical protein
VNAKVHPTVPHVGVDLRVANRLIAMVTAQDLASAQNLVPGAQEARTPITVATALLEATVAPILTAVTALTALVVLTLTPHVHQHVMARAVTTTSNHGM